MANISGIKLPDNTTLGIRATGILTGEVDSTSTATVFTATVDGVTEYYDGLTVFLKNGIVTSASGFTLNINSLGAKPCYNNLATGNDITPTAPTRDTTIFNINYTMMFIYSTTIVSGGGWICFRGYDGNTNTIGYQLRTNSTVMTVTDTARYYKLYFTSANGKQWVPASVNSTNNATSARPVNQRPIDPFGRIVYTSANTNYAAGANLAATTIWDQYTLVLGYSFNRTGAALSLTTKTPVYVKCAPQTDGSAIIDADTPYVQALPSSNDGKIYIFLGVAYDATHIELFVNHPVYYHDGTGIRLWGGAATSESDTTDLFIVQNDTYLYVKKDSTTGDNVTFNEFKELYSNNSYRIIDNSSGLACYISHIDDANLDVYLFAFKKADLTHAYSDDNDLDRLYMWQFHASSETDIIRSSNSEPSASKIYTRMPLNPGEDGDAENTFGLISYADSHKLLNIQDRAKRNELYIGQIMQTSDVRQIGMANLFTDPTTGVEVISLLYEGSTAGEDEITAIPTTNGVLTALSGYVPTSRTINGNALSSDVTLTAADVGALATSGGEVTGDITMKGAAGANSPAVIFQRGTLTDNYNDWQIQDRGGYLYFDERGQGSSAFTNRVMFNTTGGITATTFSGQLSGTISSGTTATTQAATDNSTKVATTAFVKSQGYLTLSDLPIYDGTVV